MCWKKHYLWQDFYSKNQSNHIKIVGIINGPTSLIKEYISSAKIQFPIILGNKKLAAQYKIKFVPSIILYSENQELLYKKKYREKSEFALAEIEKILKQLNVRK